ncbi:hypothetical protein ABIB35_000876 [Arthrobacter sp. UYP6]
MAHIASMPPVRRHAIKPREFPLLDVVIVLGTAAFFAALAVGIRAVEKL